MGIMDSFNDFVDFGLFLIVALVAAIVLLFILHIVGQLQKNQGNDRISSLCGYLSLMVVLGIVGIIGFRVYQMQQPSDEDKLSQQVTKLEESAPKADYVVMTVRGCERFSYKKPESTIVSIITGPTSFLPGDWDVLEDVFGNPKTVLAVPYTADSKIDNLPFYAKQATYGYRKTEKGYVLTVKLSLPKPRLDQFKIDYGSKNAEFVNDINAVRNACHGSLRQLDGSSDGGLVPKLFMSQQGNFGEALRHFIDEKSDQLHDPKHRPFNGRNLEEEAELRAKKSLRDLWNSFLRPFIDSLNGRLDHDIVGVEYQFDFNAPPPPVYGPPAPVQ